MLVTPYSLFIFPYHPSIHLQPPPYLYILLQYVIMVEAIQNLGGVSLFRSSELERLMDLNLRKFSAEYATEEDN